MSTKGTIFLSNDYNEHIYDEFGEAIKTKSGNHKNAISLEFSKENIRIDLNDDDDLCFTITNPDSEIFKWFEAIAKKKDELEETVQGKTKF